MRKTKNKIQDTQQKTLILKKTTHMEERQRERGQEREEIKRDQERRDQERSREKRSRERKDQESRETENGNQCLLAVVLFQRAR